MKSKVCLFAAIATIWGSAVLFLRAEAGRMEILKWRNGSRAAGEGFEIALTHDLPRGLYDRPLTLRTVVPDDWPAAEVRQGSRVVRAPTNGSAGSRFVIYEAASNAGPVTLARTGA